MSPAGPFLFCSDLCVLLPLLRSLRGPHRHLRDVMPEIECPSPLTVLHASGSCVNRRHRPASRWQSGKSVFLGRTTAPMPLAPGCPCPSRCSLFTAGPPSSLRPLTALGLRQIAAPPRASPTCYSRPSEHLCLPQSLTAPTDAPNPSWCGVLAGTSSSVCRASVEVACAARCSCGSEQQVPRILSSGSFPRVFLMCRRPCPPLPAPRLQAAWLPPAPRCRLGGSSAPHSTPSPTASPFVWRPVPCVRVAWCLLSLRALPWEGALPHWTPLISVRFWLTGGAQ